MIPAEAIRIVEEHLRFYVDRPGTEWTVEATAILEAVAPHIRAQALDDAANAWGPTGTATWLRARADNERPTA